MPLISKQKCDEIAKALRGGMSVIDVAKHYRCNKNSVRKIIKDYRIERKVNISKSKWKDAYSLSDYKKAVALFNENKSSREVGSILKIGKDSVSAMRKLYGRYLEGKNNPNAPRS